MDTSLLPFAYLLPIGLLLAARGGTPTDRLREAVPAALVAIIVGAVAYFGFGFALQFGGIGLSAVAPPGLRGLDLAWSPFPSGAGRWSMAGLEGFFWEAKGPPDALTLVHTLALHRLPLAMIAGGLPAIALFDRVPRPVWIASSVVSAAIVFPLAGSWIWGNGWLATLGLNLNLGHGAIDVAGSGIAFVAPAGVAVIGLRASARSSEPADTSQSALAVVGAILFGIGWAAWAASDPLPANYVPNGSSGVVVNGLAAAVAATLAAGVLAWLGSGRIRLMTLARGWLAGWAAIGASAWFIPASSAAAIGAIAGGLSMLGPYAMAAEWRLNAGAGLIATFGMAGAWGLLAAGIFADGAFGSGWNGVVGGVRGLLYSDPGQFSAQLAALVAIGLCAMCVSTPIVFAVSHVTRRHSR